MNVKEKAQQALLDGKLVGDGHSIFRPSFYEPHFSLDELKDAGLIQRYESDTSNPKSTIFDSEGNVMEYLYGVYNLSFLYWLARQLNVTEYRECFGRGSQAQALVDAIQLVLK